MTSPGRVARLGAGAGSGAAGMADPELLTRTTTVARELRPCRPRATTVSAWGPSRSARVFSRPRVR